MTIGVILAVNIVAFIQSLFGVGVMLFGIPLLLLIGYGFTDALLILLPISVTINLLQISSHYHHIDLNFYKRTLIYSVPFVVVFLFLVTKLNINISFIVGLFLLFVALKNFSSKANRLLTSLASYEKTYMIIMGIVHGVSGLGGSMLTAAVHIKNYSRDTTRVTIAATYCTFAAFQILTIILSQTSISISYVNNAVYLLAGVATYVLTEKFVYKNIGNQYSLIFSCFLVASGIVLIGKSLL